jgi:hypothetical protein
MEKIRKSLEDQFTKHDGVVDAYLCKLLNALRNKDQFLYSMYVSALMRYLMDRGFSMDWVEGIRYYPE